jgi:hypothetical protein
MQNLKRLISYLHHKPPCGNNSWRPSYEFMDLYDGIKQRSLVHFTNHDLNNGFGNLINDHRKLGLTKWLGKKHRSNDGYVFAFEINSKSMWNSFDKYGEFVVIFDSPAILVSHYGDQELQAITHSSLIRNYTLKKAKDFISNLS